MSVVLVTGGAGYVGCHAVKALAAAGYDVVVYDNLSAGHRRGRRADCQSVAGAGHRARRGECARPGALGALADARPAAVMHFAAKLDVAESVREPLATTTST